jgi:hypothetical protein
MARLRVQRITISRVEGQGRRVDGRSVSAVHLDGPCPIREIREIRGCGLSSASAWGSRRRQLYEAESQAIYSTTNQTNRTNK